MGSSEAEAPTLPLPTNKLEFDAQHSVVAALEAMVRLKHMVAERNDLVRGYSTQEVDAMLRHYEPLFSAVGMLCFGAGASHERRCRFVPAATSARPTAAEGFG